MPYPKGLRSQKHIDLKVSKSKCDKEETEAECRRFQSAREQAKEELQTLYAALEEEHPDQAKIFVAHQEVLEDEEMTEETENVIKEDCLTAERYNIQPVCRSLKAGRGSTDRRQGGRFFGC